MRRFVIVYFIFCSLFFSFFASGFVDSQDGFQYLATARRLYYDHTFTVPEVRWPDNVHMSANVGRDGEYYSPSGLGYTIALLPAVVVEDVFLRLANARPYSVFPLQNDWPLLLVASMTNAVFGALLAVVLYAYMRSFGVKHWTSVLLSFVGILSSALWVYTKHTFPHMMFVSFLTLCFYLLRKHALSNKRVYLVGAAVSFGIVVLSYNPSYLLPIPALVIYYILLHPPIRTLSWFRERVIDAVAGVLSALPLLALYVGFNRWRFGGTGTSGYDSSGNIPLPDVPTTLVPIVEGIWSVLFSPGKSIFLFSPVLVLLIIFAYKLPKKVVPEVVALGVLSIVYIWFIGTLEGGSDFLVWHGDSSWGPRYLLPIVPLALVLIAPIFVQLSKLQKIVLFWPALAVGAAIQLLGMVVPYQVRFYELPQNAYIGERKIHVSEFGNIIPRYSPIFNTAKLVKKRLFEVRSLYNHGLWNVRLYDGFEHPFNVGFSIWREPLDTAYISFDQNNEHPIQSISLQLVNHPIDPTSSISATIQPYLNGEKLASSAALPIGTEGTIALDLSSIQLKDTGNVLMLRKSFESTTSAFLKNKQVIFLQLLRINDQQQPIQTLDYPYVSPISQGAFGIQYAYFGGEKTDPWTIWHMHSGIFERTFDFWWLRPLHYWDLPKEFFATLCILQVGGVIYFAWLMVRFSPPEKNHV